MRRAFIVTLIVGFILAFAAREYRSHRKRPLEKAYVGGHGATLWDSTAQIRSPITNLVYGQPVEVYQRDAENVLVSTPAGVRGWVSSTALIDSDRWQRVTLLAEMTKPMPVQALGHMRARANLHVRPGRQSPVILEAPGDSPLVVLQHASAANLQSDDNLSTPDGNPQDWWLVRSNIKDIGDISGWVLGRLVSLNLPEPLSGYESSEGFSIVAWFEINRTADPSSNSFRQEYLVAGAHHPQGVCDFTLARVYTWSAKRRRYETAFIESDLCGKLPIMVTPAPTPGDDAYFRFRDLSEHGFENREYVMKLTTVRRIDVGSAAGKSKNGRLSRRRSHS